MLQYPWLIPAYHELITHYDSARAHHALLLQALPGNGADNLIRRVSEWLLCQNRRQEQPCGQCQACHLLRADNHPDFYYLLPENDKTTLGIDAIRQLVERLCAHTQQGGVRVIWLPEAECLSEAAANALLKTLEEPPDNTYFLLGSWTPAKLPITLRSRCFHYLLPCPNEAAAIAWLSEQIPAERGGYLTALRLTEGAPLAALRLLQQENWLQRTNFNNSLYSALQRRDLIGFLPELNKENSAERLHWLYSLMLDANKYCLGGQRHMANQDSQPLIAWLATQLSIEVLQRIAQDCSECREQLQRIPGLNRELMLIERLCRWQADLFAEEGSIN